MSHFEGIAAPDGEGPWQVSGHQPHSTVQGSDAAQRHLTRVKHRYDLFNTIPGKKRLDDLWLATRCRASQVWIAVSCT